MNTTKTEGATRAGDGKYLFDMNALGRVEAGKGYATTNGPLVEGERIQVGLMTMPRGTGARAHSHPNEQWVYIIKGHGRVSVDGQPETIAGPGSLIYIPANTIHYTVATADEDLQFFTCKDMSHGIVGMAADGTMSGPHFDPGFEPGRK